MALSGNLSTSAFTRDDGTTRTVVFSWTATQNIASNESVVSWVLKGGGTATGSKWVQISELELKIDDVQKYYRSASEHTDCYYGTELASGSFKITHNSDGTGSFKAYVGAGIYNWSINKTGTTTFTLDTIPRASTIGATDANIGANSTILVTRKSASYSHSIKYIFGNMSGYINADGSVSTSEVVIVATSISFTVPTAFYTQIPENTYGICTLMITTYSGSTKIGSIKTTTFKATAARDNCAPTVYGSVIDTNDATIALTGDSAKLIRYASTALCTITAEAKNSATINFKSIGDTTVTENTKTIVEIESSSVKFTAKDSRGYETSYTVDKALSSLWVEYIKLTANIVLTRDDPTSGKATLIISGDYFNASFGAKSNSISIKYRTAQSGGSYGNYHTVEATLDGNTYSVSVALTGLDYEYSYKAQVIVADELTSLNKTATVSQGIPVFDWGESDFSFHVPVYFNGGIAGSALLDMIYPVGSIYMSVNSTSPAALFGGTWERIQDRFLLAAGTDYSAGATGGEASHTLSTSEIPSHTHAFTGTPASHIHDTFLRDADATSSADYRYLVDTWGTGATALGWTMPLSAASGKKRMLTGPAIHTPSGTNARTGGGASHNNMPPYLAVYIWKRTA